MGSTFGKYQEHLPIFTKYQQLPMSLTLLDTTRIMSLPWLSMLDTQKKKSDCHFSILDANLIGDDRSFSAMIGSIYA